jgi:hypothetical protein
MEITHDQRLLTGIFNEEKQAEQTVNKLIKEDFPMDYISIMGKAQHSGDDPIGIYYQSTGERVRSWGSLGAIWGGILGLLTGAAGLFFVPGLGAVMAAGPIVQALVGGAAGTAVGGGVMSAAATVSHLITALRRMGVSEDKLEHVQEAVKEGKYIVMLRIGTEQEERWSKVLREAGASEVLAFRFQGIGTA